MEEQNNIEILDSEAAVTETSAIDAPVVDAPEKPEKKKGKFKWSKIFGEKRSPLQKSVFVIIFIIFVLYALTMLFPFIWLILNSFKSGEEFFLSGRSSFAFPLKFTAENYGMVFSEYNFGLMFLRSLLLAGGGTLLTLITSSMAAYTVAKYKFPGRGIIYGVVIFALIVPVVGTLPAQYALMKGLGLSNSFIGVLIIYSGGFGFNFLLLYSYFKNLSWGYAEAALVDGAGDFRVFWRIMIPLSRPALVAVGIIQFIGLWNDYQSPYLYWRSNPTLAVGLQDLYTQYKNTPAEYPAIFAAIVLALIPIVTIFCVFSKIIMENTVVGGLKG